MNSKKENKKQFKFLKGVILFQLTCFLNREMIQEENSC